MKVDCNSKYVYLNPYKGGMIAVCESARNVACTGATPLAITNCLNFGNPYNPEVYFQFAEAVRGIGDACKVLETPVTGGNVSFYNQSKDYAVYPTPTIGMIGLIENIELTMTSHFKKTGDIVILVGELSKNIGGSEYLSRIHGLVEGDSPEIDPVHEKRLVETLLSLIGSKHINSAHDISDGGIAVALAECCFTGNISKLGCEIVLEDVGSRADFLLFSESQGCAIVSAEENKVADVLKICSDFGLKASTIGKTIEEKFMINNVININVKEIDAAYHSTIEMIMEKQAEVV
jgi:phosphoribosylformylglycinamidine synthase